MPLPLINFTTAAILLTNFEAVTVLKILNKSNKETTVLKCSAEQILVPMVATRR